MEPFLRVYEMVDKDGNVMTVEEFAKLAYDGGPIEVYRNSKYQCFKRVVHSKNPEMPDLIWLSIKLNTKEAIHDWRDLQEIKNMMVGPECEGVELYPAESRRVDTSNQFHIWVMDSTTFRWPFGYQDRLVSNSEEAKKMGAKQRPLDLVKYEPFNQMGMDVIKATYKGVEMTLAEGDSWVCIYSCESKNKGKGEVQEMIELIKKDFPGKQLNGSVPLNPTMEHIYKKCGVYYEDGEKS